MGSNYSEEVSHLFHKLANVTLEPGKKTEGSRYIRIHNRQGKEWFFPLDNIICRKIAVDLYHPMTTKGKLIKFAAVYFYPLLCLGGLADRTAISCNAVLTEAIEEAFHKDISKLQFSFFLGTPCAFQKLIVQVAQEDCVLGYIKFSNNPSVCSGFQRESEYLKWLQEHGVDGIPSVVKLDTIIDRDTMMFAQSTRKDIKSKEIAWLSDPVFRFINKLNTRTASICSFWETDYYKKIKNIEEEADHYFGEDIEPIRKGKAAVSDYFDKCDCYCACHGDFTPWNSFLTSDSELFVFDFEYAMHSCPKGMDLFHWMISVLIFKGVHEPKQIWDAVMKEKQRLESFVDDYTMTCLAYLLVQVVNTLRRGRGDYSDEEKRNLHIWIDIIRLIALR